MQIDWMLLILLLRKHGTTTAQASRDLKMDYQHLRNLGDGSTKEPRFNKGVKLLDYAVERMPIEEFLKVRIL